MHLFDQIFNHQEASALEAEARQLRADCRHGAIECDCYERANQNEANARKLRGER